MTQMIPIVLDENLQRVGMVDYYRSFIWTERYNTPGDFEIVCPVTAALRALVKLGRYVIRDDRQEVGIIETIRLTSEYNRGEHMALISGRFASSILQRRIVDVTTKFKSKTAAQIIRQLVQSHILSPSNTARKIDIFDMDTTTVSGSRIKSAQFTGKTLLEVTESLCEEKGFGFRTYISGTGKITLHIYAGTDRRATAVFSPAFDNLDSEEYEESITARVTNVLTAGEGEGTARKTAWATVDNPTGLDRYELYQDARNLRDDADDTAAYLEELEQQGLEEITPYTQAHMAEIVPGVLVYKQDWDVGDIITIRNDTWGILETPRIVEVIESMDETGRYSITPSFAE